MAQIRFARWEDCPRLKRLWKAAFGDEDSYIDGFYQDRFSPQETMVLEEEGALQAMLTLLPMETVLAGGERVSTPCVYAVATSRESRGRGYATGLLAQAHRTMEERGDKGAVIVPAGDSLFAFYRQRGFADGFSLRERRLTPEELLPAARDPRAQVTALAPGEYHRRREALLQGSCHVDCGEEGLVYQDRVGRRSGGGLLAVDVGPVQGCAAVERDGDRLILKELLLPPAVMEAGLAAVADRFTCREILLRAPLGAGEAGGDPRPFAQVRWYDRRLAQAFAGEAPGYLGIAYD